MSRHKAAHEKRPFSTSDWRPGRGTKVVAFLTAGMAGLISAAHQHWYEWVGATLAASAAIVVPVFAYRTYWNQARFWIPLLLLTILQIPAVLALAPVIESYRFPALFVFAITDCVFVLAIIYWVIYWPRSSRG